MPRTAGAKDKKKRNIVKTALKIGAAGAIGYGLYRGGKFIHRTKTIADNLSKNPEKAYKAYKEGGENYQKLIRATGKKGRQQMAAEGYDAAGLESQKSIRRTLLEQYRADTGLDKAVNAYKSARKHASVDLKDQPEAAKRIAERQKAKLKAKVEKVGNRKKHLYLSSDWSKIYIPRFLK